MKPRYAQSINQPLTINGNYFNSTLNAGLVGATVGTGTLRFNAAGTMDALLYAEQGVLADDGTSIAILQPGVYHVEACVQQAAGASNTFALSLGATVVTNVAAPTWATGGVLSLRPAVITTALDTHPVIFDTMILVRQATAKTTPAVTSANTLRILATASAGGIVTNLTAAGCSLRVTRVNDFIA